MGPLALLLVLTSADVVRLPANILEATLTVSGPLATVRELGLPTTLRTLAVPDPARTAPFEG